MAAKETEEKTKTRQNSITAVNEYFSRSGNKFDYFGTEIIFEKVLSMTGDKTRFNFSLKTEDNVKFELSIPKKVFLDEGILSEKSGYYTVKSYDISLFIGIMKKFISTGVEKLIVKQAPQPIVEEPKEDKKEIIENKEKEKAEVKRAPPDIDPNAYAKELVDNLIENSIRKIDAIKISEDVLTTSGSYVVPKQVKKDIRYHRDVEDYLNIKPGKNEVIRFVPAMPTPERPINIIGEVLRASESGGIEIVDKVAITQTAEQLQKCGFTPKGVGNLARLILEARKKGLYKSKYEEDLLKPRGRAVSREKELETIRSLKKETLSKKK